MGVGIWNGNLKYNVGINLMKILLEYLLYVNYIVEFYYIVKCIWYFGVINIYDINFYVKIYGSYIRFVIKYIYF